jgi:hypothetical protein
VTRQTLERAVAMPMSGHARTPSHLLLLQNRLGCELSGLSCHWGACGSDNVNGHPESWKRRCRAQKLCNDNESSTNVQYVIAFDGTGYVRRFSLQPYNEAGQTRRRAPIVGTAKRGPRSRYPFKNTDSWTSCRLLIFRAATSYQHKTCALVLCLPCYS